MKRAGDLLKIPLYLFQSGSSTGRIIDPLSFSFFEFPVVLLARSAAEGNREGDSLSAVSPTVSRWLPLLRLRLRAGACELRGCVWAVLCTWQNAFFSSPISHPELKGGRPKKFCKRQQVRSEVGTVNIRKAPPAQEPLWLRLGSVSRGARCPRRCWTDCILQFKNSRVWALAWHHMPVVLGQHRGVNSFRLSFMWVLGNWTQAVRLVWPALYLLIHLAGPH